MKKIVMRQTVTEDYFEVDCKTDEAAKEQTFRGWGSLLSTRSRREWIVVPEVPPETEPESESDVIPE